MAKVIQWKKQLEKVLSRAQRDNKPILFFPQPGVNRMPADGSGYVPRFQSYRLPHAASDPFAVTHDHKPLSDEFRVKWTPALVTLDRAGRIK
jgi:hypothetical protein